MIVFHLLLISLLASSCNAGIRFASPLQSLTFWDNHEVTSTSPPAGVEGEAKDVETTSNNDSLPRSQFLAKYRAGLTAEQAVKAQLDAKYASIIEKQDQKARDWPTKSAYLQRRRQEEERRLLLEAYEKATASVAEQQKLKAPSSSSTKEKASSAFQLVGVIEKDHGESGGVKWYARKKPPKARWSTRLVHVNQDAIIKDLYDQGRLDIVAKYKNENGKVLAEYIPKERSWRTLWNFSPLGVLHDSSGHYWRERRLKDGVYSDGNGNLYEMKYSYKYGKNAMIPLRNSKLETYMNRKGFTEKQKAATISKIKNGEPDVVYEGPK